MAAKSKALTALQDLGLNQMEAEVYLYLLNNEPVTAYAVGKAIGKATANVYKAVESLGRVGAVMIEDGNNRLCRAVPLAEFVARLKRGFVLRARAAETALASVAAKHFDERVYRIEDAEEVLDRCERMLDSASEVAMIDAFPTAISWIGDAAIRAAKRGVDVRVEAYRDVQLPGCDVVVATTGESSVERWGAEQLNVVIDGREVLIALLSPDLERVHQALWSQSLYLSCLIHSGRMSEHTLHRVNHAVHCEPADSPSREALDKHRFFTDGGVPGQLDLFERFALREVLDT